MEEAEERREEERAAPREGGTAGGGLFADPAALARIAEVLQKTDLSSLLDAAEEKSGDASEGASGGTPPRAGAPDVASLLSAVTGKGGSSDKRTALLLALKPYLSPRRREIVDYLLRMNRLGDVLRRLS